MAAQNAVMGTTPEIMQHIMDVIPPSPLLELWSDHDSTDRHLLGSIENEAGNGVLSQLSERKIGAILPRELRRTERHLGRPEGAPQQSVETRHDAQGDSEHHRLVFLYLQEYARLSGKHADAIIPVDFRSAEAFSVLPQRSPAS